MTRWKRPSAPPTGGADGPTDETIDEISQITDQIIDVLDAHSASPMVGMGAITQALGMGFASLVRANIMSPTGVRNTMEKVTDYVESILTSIEREEKEK